MAATTTLLGLLTPTQGTLSGTWGDSVNYGISDYVDIAIAGTLTFTGDGAVTLANTTGSASGNGFTTTTAQYMVIRITGTQTVTKVITGPSYSKLYLVDHAGATSAVTFKAAGQTGVSIAVGEKAFVFYNGTDYVKIAGTTSGAAGGSNTQVQFNSSGALAGSANMTFNGTTLTAGGLTTTGATSTGTLSATGVATFSAGTVSLPALTTTGDTNTGIFFPAADTIAFTEGGAESMRIDSSGNVGIGTSSPATKLDVTNGYTTDNNVSLTLTNSQGAATDNGAIAYRTSTGAGFMTSAQINSGPGSAYAASYLKFRVADSSQTLQERMRIDVSGNLGIGTTAPTTKFDVNTAVGNTQNIATIRSSNVQLKIGTTDIGNGEVTYNVFPTSSSSTAGAHIWQGGGTELMKLNNGGILGVGVTPQTGWSGFKAIQLGANTSLWSSTSGGGTSYYSNNLYYNGTNRIYITSAFASEYQQTNTGTHSWFSAPSGTAGNAISLTTTMTLDTSGNLVATGNVTAYSDERLKKEWSALPSDFIEQLAKVKSGTYTRIDNDMRQAGSSAQDWQTLLPEVVLTGEDEAKTLSLAYGNAALVSVIELAKRLVALEAEVKALKGE